MFEKSLWIWHSEKAVLDDYGDFNDEIIKYPPADPTRDGYEFAGWSLDGKNVENLENLKIYADTILKAIYILK